MVHHIDAEVSELEVTEQNRTVVEEGFAWIDGYFTRLAASRA